MFEYERCIGCDEFDNCEHNGKWWNCQYSQGIQEDIEREEDDNY